MDELGVDLDERPILVIDDEEELRQTMLELLLEIGFEAEAVANGQLALERLQSGPVPWLVLLDLRMPVMDGRAFRFEQRRCAALSAIPVVLVTGDREIEQHALALGVDDYLRKPVCVGELTELLRRLAGQRGASAAHFFAR